MVTTFCYYPAWRKLPADRGRIYRTDAINGVPVHRCWHYVPRKVSAAKRIFHEGTFVGFSFFRLIWLRLVGGRQPDVLVVISPPLLLGAAAWAFGRLTGIKFVFHVQDLQPDAALGLGMLKPGMLSRALYRLETLAYSAASSVSGISRGMLEAFASKGLPGEKRIYFPNPVVLPDLEHGLPARGAFRRRNGFKDDEFLVIYSGNLGVKQGLHVIVEAARKIKAPGEKKRGTVARTLRLVICGDGAERETLAKLAAEGELQSVLTLLPLQGKEQYHEMLVDADVCLITQQAGSGRSFFPSKLLTTLAFAKPVVTVADSDSELVRALQEGGFGVNVPPGHPERLVEALQELATDGAALNKMTQRGRAYVAQFAAEKVFDDFERVLQDVCEVVGRSGTNRRTN